MYPAMLYCGFAWVYGGIAGTHSVLEQEKAAEEAEEIGSEQREVNCCGAGHVDHHRHAAVQRIHAYGKAAQEQS